MANPYRKAAKAALARGDYSLAHRLAQAGRQAHAASDRTPTWYEAEAQRHADLVAHIIAIHHGTDPRHA